mmetsp:Transcript_100681/g.215802  ORF Transcript_100681/g.215802 Transcript_100681/m.215802 type:complete len:200 (-) Transcript_100681:593-1192(-)
MTRSSKIPRTTSQATPRRTRAPRKTQRRRRRKRRSAVTPRSRQHRRRHLRPGALVPSAKLLPLLRRPRRPGMRLRRRRLRHTRRRRCASRGGKTSCQRPRGRKLPGGSPRWMRLQTELRPNRVPTPTFWPSSGRPCLLLPKRTRRVLRMRLLDWRKSCRTSSSRRSSRRRRRPSKTWPSLRHWGSTNPSLSWRSIPEGR